MNDLLLDLRQALRALRRQPGFAATAILTLGLGIGATTAVVSLAHEALLTPPPVREPARLAMVYTGSRRGAPRSATSYPDFLDYQARTRAFTDLAAYSWIPLSMGGESETGLLSAQVVTGNYFQLLGVAPVLGRVLQPSDDTPGTGAALAVVSHDFWRRRLGAAPDAAGTVIRLNGVPVTVVGVAPAGFRGLTAGRGAELWMAMQAAPLMGEGIGSAGDPATFTDRGSRWIAGIVGRLADGVHLSQARADMTALSAQLAGEDPGRGGRAITVDPLPRRILPIGTEADIARFLALLIVVVICALLLTSINLASLLLARATARQREMGIRLSVGAGRGRLVRQLLTEGVVLAGAGGAAGVLIALFTIDLLAGFALPGGLPLRDLAVGLDARLLSAAAGASLASVLLFGLAPALQSTRAPVLTALRGDAPRGSGHLRRWLVSVQVALCLMLLVGAGLFLRTLQGALRFDTGFQPDGVAVARYSLALLRYPAEARVAFAERLLARVPALPGVEGAALATLVPLQPGGHLGLMAQVEGYQPAPDEEMRTDLVRVTAGYFDVLGIPLLSGRPVLETDRAGGQPVAVVSRTAAERWWRGRDAVGGTVTLGGIAHQVVGVAADVTWETPGAPVTPYVFVPLVQGPAPRGSLTLAVRTSGSTDAILPLMRGVFQDLDPDLSLMAVGPLEGWLADTMGAQRTGAALLSLFGLLAVIIAALGIYGVVAFHVSRETRAIGVRLALGAPRAHVVGLVARSIGGPVGLGVAAGLVLAWVLAGTVERFLFGVAAHDGATFAAMALSLATVAGLATLGPVRRALRINPTEALRHE